MQENQIKIYKDIQNILNTDLHDNKTRSLIALAYEILSGSQNSIEFYVKTAISYGATKRDFLNIISCIIGDRRFFDTIMEFLRIIYDNFEENKNDRFI